MGYTALLIFVAFPIALIGLSYIASRLGRPFISSTFAAIALIFGPTLVTSIFVGSEHPPQIRTVFDVVGLIALLSVPLLWVISRFAFRSGLRFPSLDERHRTNKVLAIPFGFLCVVSLAAYAVNRASEIAEQKQRSRLEQDRNIAQWHQAEARLKECAETLTETLGVADARVNHAKGDRRLYAVTSYGQEMSSTSVPGIEIGADGFSGFYRYVTGRAPGDRHDMAYGVENSPKGQIWSDPWGQLSGSMGRAPPSAKACTDATGRYVNAYNTTMLELGVLRKAVAPRTEPVPARMHSLGVIWGLYDSFDRNLTRADYPANLLRPIDVLATRHGILTQADVDLDVERSLAMDKQVSTSHVMGFDRNDDGVVTREEMERIAKKNSDTSTLQRLLEEYDLDDDGRITKGEIEEVAAERNSTDYYDVSRVRAIIDLDPNHDGQLTSTELTMLGKSAFANVDKDGDGVVSPKEYEITEGARWKVSREAGRRATDKYGPTCRIPTAPPGAKVIYVAVYTSKQSGPFVINGQPMDAQIIDVHISSGQEPLYLILGSYERMIWKFSGATDRVATAVLSSLQRTGLKKSAAAAMALPTDRTVVLRGKCREYLYNGESRDDVEPGSLIRRSLGRKPDRIITNYELNTVTIP